MAPSKTSKGVREAWVAEQSRLAKLCVEADELDWCVVGESIQGLRHVAGVDVSFFPDGLHAVAAVVVISFPEMQVLYERCATFQLKVPYMAGFLAFREVPALKAMLEKVPSKWQPQVVLVDGNGVFHPRRCGSATHLGIVTGLPTVGVAKDVLQVGDVKLSVAQKISEKLQRKEDWAPLVASEDHGDPLAILLRTNEGQKNVVVSAGHKISLNTAARLTASLCKASIPEPIRQADLRSRAAVRAWFDGISVMKLKLPKQEGAGDLLQITMAESDPQGSKLCAHVNSKNHSVKGCKTKMMWRVKVNPSNSIGDADSNSKNSTELDLGLVSVDGGDWGLCWFLRHYFGGLCVLRA